MKKKFFFMMRELFKPEIQLLWFFGFQASCHIEEKNKPRYKASWALNQFEMAFFCFFFITHNPPQNNKEEKHLCSKKKKKNLKKKTPNLSSPSPFLPFRTPPIHSLFLFPTQNGLFLIGLNNTLRLGLREISAQILQHLYGIYLLGYLKTLIHKQ